MDGVIDSPRLSVRDISENLARFNGSEYVFDFLAMLSFLVALSTILQF